MSSNIAKNEKWYKPYDPIIWIALLVIFIAVMTYQGNNSGYDNKEISFNKNITTIKEAIDETDKIIKKKYGDKYQLYSISGNSINIHKDVNIQPDLQISYLKVKGSPRKVIEYNVSLEDDKIQSTYISTNPYLEKEVKFEYKQEKLDINKILNIVESKVDMEKVRSGYDPYLNFNIIDNEMSIDVGYYKSMKNSGVDYNSGINYRFIVDIKTQRIKSESTEGVS